MSMPPADPGGAGDPSFGGWSFWSMQKNRGLSPASTTPMVNNEGYSAWTSVDGEWRPRSPIPKDPLAPEYYHDITEFYLEAARRLPIADIPGLARCISYRGLAVGLADPVTNIVLTTINAFAKKPPGPGYFFAETKPDDALEQTKKRITFAGGARNSRAGLVMFMLCYFRHMTEAQAKHFLGMAGHDLPLAILLVEAGCRGCHVPQLRPDAARTKTALQQAAYWAGWRSDTDDLVRLMTWRYPRELLDPVLDDLRGGKQLSADCVYKICDLLRCSWPPPPTPAPTPGFYRDNSGNVTTIIKIREGVFATTTISRDLVATTTITSTCPTHDDDDDNVHLSTVLAIERSSRVNNTWRENPDFLPLLKMSLLRTIHGFYIDALGILPNHALRERHLVSAVLTAGHCYGPMDPVSNIILNSIWYNAAFPVPEKICNRVGAADILDPRSMSRVESRSLDGFVAFVCCTYSISEQQAVILLCEHRFNLPSLLQQGSKKILSNLASTALVAKHPQPAAFEDFLDSLNPSKLDCLRSLIVSDRTSGYALSDDTLNRIKEMVSKETTDNAATTVPSTAPRLGQANLYRVAERRSTFKAEQAYIRTRLENLLLDYGGDEGHTYKLGIICGVTTARYSFRYCIHAYCFHVNFLASSDVSNDDTRSYCSWELFFAEFWDRADERIEQSTNLPFCCPVRDFIDAYSIRCIVCDHTSCMIAHPSSGKYYTGNTRPGFPVHRKWGDDLRGMLELDFIYFDRRNSESAKTLLKESPFVP